MNTSSFPSLLISSPGAPRLSFPRLESLDWSCLLLVEGVQGGKPRVQSSSSACHAGDQHTRPPAKGLGQDIVGVRGLDSRSQEWFDPWGIDPWTVVSESRFGRPWEDGIVGPLPSQLGCHFVQPCSLSPLWVWKSSPSFPLVHRVQALTALNIPYCICPFTCLQHSRALSIWGWEVFAIFHFGPPGSQPMVWHMAGVTKNGMKWETDPST